MPSLLGKRKSRPVEEESEASMEAQELLKRHFEARFKPLTIAAAHAAPKVPANDPGADDSDGCQDDDDSDADTGESDSEWSGVSDSGNTDEDEDGMLFRCLAPAAQPGDRADKTGRDRHGNACDRGS
jgi:hypothetical protein